MPQNTEIKKLLAEYSAGVRKLKKSVHQLTKKEMDFRPFEGAWTIHEHVVHLTDMETNAYIRWKCIVGESGKPVMTLSEDEWVKNIRSDIQPVSDQISIFSLLRKVTAHYLAENSGNPDFWEKNFIVHPERGDVNMKEWLKLYSAHAEIHVKYIERNKNIWKKSHTK